MSRGIKNGRLLLLKVRARARVLQTALSNGIARFHLVLISWDCAICILSTGLGRCHLFSAILRPVLIVVDDSVIVLFTKTRVTASYRDDVSKVYPIRLINNSAGCSKEEVSLQIELRIRL